MPHITTIKSRFSPAEEHLADLTRGRQDQWGLIVDEIDRLYLCKAQDVVVIGSLQNPYRQYLTPPKQQQHAKGKGKATKPLLLLLCPSALAWDCPIFRKASAKSATRAEHSRRSCMVLLFRNPMFLGKKPYIVMRT